MMNRSVHSLTAVALLTLGAVACGKPAADPPPGVGGQGGSGGQGGGGHEPVTVPSEPPTVNAEGFCVSREPGEKLSAVSPGGHAWLTRSEAGTTVVRVFDPMTVEPLAPTPSEVAVLEVSETEQMMAWGGAEATVPTPEQLWVVEAMNRVAVHAPVAMNAVSSACGRLSERGALVTGGVISELRDGTWWSWDGLVGEPSEPRSWLRFDGQCVGPSNQGLLFGKDGSLLELGPSSYRVVARFEPNAQVAATDGLVAVLETQRLHLGSSEFTAYVFEGQHPERLSASAGRVWLGGGAQLLRFENGSFVQVSHPLGATIERLRAYPAGAWLSGGDAFCHVNTEPLVRVEGLLPYEGRAAAQYEVVVRSTDASQPVSLSLGQSPITLTPSAETGAFTAQFDVAELGWQQLTVTAAEHARVMPFKRLPEVTRSWAEDIAPIFSNHCSGGSCHGGGSTAAPVFDTHGAWVEAAQTIQNRVVFQQTMPPSSHQDAAWPEKRQIIAEWLEGGMLP